MTKPLIAVWCLTTDSYYAWVRVRLGVNKEQQVNSETPKDVELDHEVERLTSFLYALMRDEVLTGAYTSFAMRIAKDLEAHPGPHTYSAKGLADYAEELAKRILGRPM